jgi:hypothetical protein
MGRGMVDDLPLVGLIVIFEVMGVSVTLPSRVVMTSTPLNSDSRSGKESRSRAASSRPSRSGSGAGSTVGGVETGSAERKVVERKTLANR